RKVEHRVDVLLKAALRHVLAGRRGGGQEEAQTRIALLKIGRDRARRERFADRHRMDPDRFVAVDVERNRQIAETLPEAADVLVVADRLVHKVREYQTEPEQSEEAIREVHRGPPIVE